MKLLLATSIKFPSELANRIQVTEMSKAFYDCLGRESFYFGGRNLPNVDNRKLALIRIGGKKKSFLFALKYLKNIKEKNITHVYCREEKLLFFMLFFNRIFFHIPVIFIFESHFAPKRILWWQRFLLRNSNLIVVTSPAIENVFTGYADAKKIIVAPHGVDIHQFDIKISPERARRMLDLPIDVPLVGYFGTLRTMGNVTKGMDIVLKAIAATGDVHMIAVGGEADDIELYQHQANQLGIADRVVFRRRVSKEKLAVYQKACDALLLPMPANQYISMLPLKVFEYMASGRPIIASRLPSLEGVINENNAFLFEAGSFSELAQKISFVLNNKNEAQRRAKQAFEDVKNCTWKARAEKIITAIRIINHKDNKKQYVVARFISLFGSKKR